MKVLVISVDVSGLSDEQVDQLRIAMEAQVEVDYAPEEAYILSSGVRLLDEEGEEIEEIDTNLH